jgi:hypothetical protein
MTLDLLAARWRRRWRAAGAITTLGAALLGAAAGRAAGWSVAAILGAALALATAAALGWWLGRPRVDARAVARHLDRQWAELGESAELLLVPPDTLSGLERLQRERTARAFERLAPTVVLPHRPWRRGLAFGGAAIVIAGALLLVPRRPSAAAGAALPGPAAERPLRVGDVVTEIAPPAYSARPTRRGTGWDLEAEAGSVVRWRIAVSPGTIGGALVTAGQDTVPLVLADDGTLAGRLEVERSTLYFVTTRDSSGRSLAADFHQLTVIPDAAPTITVLAPEPRTSIAPGAPSAVPLRVLVGDDYGVTDTRLVATLTTGQGEGVKFREQELPFERTSPRPDRRPGQLLERTLDPRALGLGPGDELYFYVTARDNRAPDPQVTRSETFFVTLVDTARALTADFTGLAVNLVPEYFRSQRQIIIDTERLLAERQRLTPEEFRNRSENIGLDQHLLRLRYGEIVGDEIVEGEVDAGARHEHDIEDNATRLAPQVKATLQASLAQMWQAELKLRMSDPQAALPFEYRALELLKEVQQAARVYVRRVGFEPPPLEPDRKRLTGDLSKIGRPETTRELTARDTLPGIRAALAVVRRLRAGGTPAAGDRAALEQSGRELAALAVAEPGRYLTSLGTLRALIDSRGGGAGCAGCAELEADLLRALPAPPPAQPGAAAASGVARTYFELLRAP